MNIFRILLATFCLWASGFLCITPAEALYGGGQQADVYPQRITGARFGELARAKVEAELKAAGETRRYELLLQHEPPAMALPAGSVECKTELPKGLNYGGTTTPVHINVYVDGKFFRRAIGYFRVTVYDKVLVAIHDIGLEKPITAADVHLEEREVTRGSGEYYDDIAKIGDRVAGRIIRTGTAITTNMLRNPAVMDVGAPITLVTNYNGVAVRTEGVALQKGRIGATIRVRNARSGKMLRGRVIDATTVQIGS